MCGFFFFQAEDGIRDLVRSRGLGDVYKRQEVWLNGMEITQFTYFQQVGGLDCKPVTGEITYGPVSYTHLTLPTSDLV